jgi:hypothetical protein
MLVTTETKQVTVRGTKYTIKRFNLEEGSLVDRLIASNKDKLVEQQAIMVFYGTVEPKFESIEAVKAVDKETVLHLWVELQRFNVYETSFLSLLKNSPSQESPTPKTKRL